MKKRKKKIKQRMFETYVCALIIVVTVFIVVYLTQTYRMMQDQITDSMKQLSGNVVDRLDDEIQQLSLLSERITFSEDVRRIFFTKLPESQGGADSYRLVEQLDATMYGIVGPKLSFYHMNLINLNGYRYAFGQEYNYKQIENNKLEQIPWLEDTIEKGGKLVISPTSETVLNRIPANVISLSRSFGARIGGTTSGAVEVQIAYEHLEELILSTVYLDGVTNQERAVIVFDQNGNIIYPIDLEHEVLKHYREIAASLEGEDYSNKLMKNTATGEKEHVFSSTSDLTKWKILLVVPDSVLKSPIKQLVLQIIFLGLLMVFGVSIFSRWMSNIYTTPIEKLYNSVKELTLEDINSDYNVSIEADVDELEQLNKVFNKMVLRLHQSLDEVVESRNMEMHARMLALQAQMNPHFLYNTLTVISIMADNGEKENVRWACRNLSDMLAYISSEALHLVNFSEEMKHTKSYMTLIEMRYMEDIEFQIDIPENMENILIPKLVLQPLVENAVKYATNTQPVWKIRIKGWIEGEKWFLTVEDNGNGFPTEIIWDINQKIRYIEETGKIPELYLNGMGILNIFLRLRFNYKTEAVFQMENSIDHGARIMIGGIINDKDTV